MSITAPAPAKVDPTYREQTQAALQLALKISATFPEDVLVSVSATTYIGIEIHVHDDVIPAAEALAHQLGLTFERYLATPDRVHHVWSGDVDGIRARVVVLVPYPTPDPVTA